MTKRYEGYHDERTLPIKQGMTVTIKKGTMVKTFGKDPKPAGKTYKVKVVFLGCGQNAHVYRGEAIPAVNPSVSWAGPGGYWSDVDINDLPEVNEAE
jgi:hypothetical protein